MALNITPVQPGFVARVEQVALSAPPQQAQIEAIEAAFERYGVLIFPDQPLSAEEQVRFASSFGSLEITAEGFREDGDKQFWKRDAGIGDGRLAEISNLDHNRALFSSRDPRRFFGFANRHWHTDSTFRPIRARFTILAGRRVPDLGAATDFADMCAAYEALPERIKTRIGSLEAVHSAARVLDIMGVRSDDGIEVDFPLQRWPIVTRLGDGRKALCVPSHASHVADMPIPDGRVLLMELREFAVQSRFVHRHEWRTNDVVMWDNRSTMHRATPFEDETQVRELRRSVVEDVPGETAASAKNRHVNGPL